MCCLLKKSIVVAGEFFLLTLTNDETEMSMVEMGSRQELFLVSRSRPKELLVKMAQPVSKMTNILISKIAVQ